MVQNQRTVQRPIKWALANSEDADQTPKNAVSDLSTLFAIRTDITTLHGSGGVCVILYSSFVLFVVLS